MDTIRHLRPEVLLALQLVMAVTLTGCEKKADASLPAAAPPPPEVSVLTVHPQRLPLTTELPGRTSSYRVAEIRPQVGGVILQRMFTEGGDVKAGQQLYQIDPASYRASLASARATLAKAQATVRSAQLTVDRYKPLVQANAVSRQDYDNAVASLQQDQADVESGKASVQTAEINLAYTKMLSPISGRTSRSSITEGALVTTGQTTSLVTVTQLDPIYVDVTQPISLLLRLRREFAQGQLKAAGDNQAQVSLLLEDGSEYDQPGKLQFSEVTVDQGTGSVTLRAVFPNPHGVLLPGMFVRERLEEGVNEQALLVPQQAVTHTPQGAVSALFVTTDNKVEPRTLKTDRAIGDKWLISDGLKDGDRIIVEGLQKVQPGMTVLPKEMSAGDVGQTTQQH
ncbi:MAG: efflux RND transporter periplasmic adaptor subunit [Acidobacteriaceae bacterium]|nr:efflux RND transporter periplasmic adaptor subunit [Acidobacteriaceae bacterium]